MVTLFTYQDAVEHALDYLGGNPSDQTTRDCVRAVQNAYRELADAFNWSYLYKEGFFISSGAYPGGSLNIGISQVTPPAAETIQYQQVGPLYLRQVTLSGGTWPDWADQGAFLRFANPAAEYYTGGATENFVAYRVARRWSDTILTLDPQINPGMDTPAGTSFILYRDTYLLPEDFVSADQALFERNFGGMDYVHPASWLYETRYVFAQGVPQHYTITGDDTYYPGRLVIRIYPWPYETKSIAYIYKRRPRPLLSVKLFSGTVSGTAGQPILTASTAVFTPKVEQAVVRLSLTRGVLPTGLYGANPADFETTIRRFVSPTQIELVDNLDVIYTNASYVVSDRVDIEEVMKTAFMRGIEKQVGIARVLKDKPNAAMQYDIALREAKAADSRNFTGRAVSEMRPLRRRLRDYPIYLGGTE